MCQQRGDGIGEIRYAVRTQLRHSSTSVSNRNQLPSFASVSCWDSPHTLPLDDVANQLDSAAINAEQGSRLRAVRHQPRYRAPVPGNHDLFPGFRYSIHELQARGLEVGCLDDVRCGGCCFLLVFIDRVSSSRLTAVDTNPDVEIVGVQVSYGVPASRHRIQVPPLRPVTCLWGRRARVRRRRRSRGSCRWVGGDPEGVQAAVGQPESEPRRYPARTVPAACGGEVRGSLPADRDAGSVAAYGYALVDGKWLDHAAVRAEGFDPQFAVRGLQVDEQVPPREGERPGD